MEQTINKLKQIFGRLMIFRTLKRESLIRELLALEDLPGGEETFPSWYGKLLERYPEADNCWSAYLNNLIATDENYFSLHCEQAGLKSIPTSILEAVKSDLYILLALLQWNPATNLFTANTPSLPNIPNR